MLERKLRESSPDLRRTAPQHSGRRARPAPDLPPAGARDANLVGFKPNGRAARHHRRWSDACEGTSETCGHHPTVHRGGRNVVDLVDVGQRHQASSGSVEKRAAQTISLEKKRRWLVYTSHRLFFEENSLKPRDDAYRKAGRLAEAITDLSKIIVFSKKPFLPETTPPVAPFAVEGMKRRIAAQLFERSTLFTTLGKYQKALADLKEYL